MIEPAVPPAQAEPPAQNPEAVPTVETPRAGAVPDAQTWIIAGLVVVVTLLVVIAFQLFRPAAGANPDPAGDPILIESQWREKPGLPSPRTRAAAATFDNAIYVIGGKVNGEAAAGLVRFDAEAGTWTPLASKPTAVSEIRAAVLGGRIYVPGGRLASGEVSAALEIYDPAVDRWESGPSLQEGRSAYALAAFEGKLYLFGGWDGQDYSDRVFVFNPDTGNWGELSPMPLQLGWQEAVVAGGRIFVIGGFDGASASRAALIYNPAQEGVSPWTRGQDMPEGRYAMGLVSIADRIHLIGGIGGTQGHFSQMEYTPQTGLWQVIENPLAGEWSHVAAAALGTEIYVFGGELEGAATDRTLAYQVLFIVVIPVVP